MVFYKSDSKGEKILMVSGTIAPLTAQVEFLVSNSGAGVCVFTALGDSG